MGRHSAPDDDALDGVDTAASAGGGTAVVTAEAEVALAGRHGRHVRLDDVPNDGRDDVPGAVPGAVPDGAPEVTREDDESDGGLLADLINGFGSEHDESGAAPAEADAAVAVLAPPQSVPAVAAPPAHIAPPHEAAVGETAADESKAAAGETAVRTPKRTAGGSRSDLRLLREHGDVRARVIAGALAPFAIYTVVMAVLGQLDRSYLLWIWIPLVTAGVLGGLFLDLGHRRYRPVPDSVPEAASRR